MAKKKGRNRAFRAASRGTIIISARQCVTTAPRGRNLFAGVRLSAPGRGIRYNAGARFARNNANIIIYALYK